MVRTGVVGIVCALAAGCVAHWPTFQPPGRPGHPEVSIWESIGYGVAASALTLAIHELGHAAMGEIAGADDVEIRVIDENRLAFTRVRGDFSKGESLLIDLAGVIATYGLGEVLEHLMVHDVLPDCTHPFFATWTLILKGDLYNQTSQGLFDEGSDFAEFSRESGVSKAAFFGLIGVDLLFHHETYLWLLGEANLFTIEDGYLPK